MLAKIFTPLACIALILSACAPSTTAAYDTDPGENGYYLTEVKPDPEVRALVPENLKKVGILKNVSATDYAPAEYRKTDGKTPTGYDIDLARAIAKTMGLKDARTTHYTFADLLKKVGSTADVAISSFTITAQRETQTNMVSYMQAWSQYAVAVGNPKKFDSTRPCGTTIGVQNGTFQLDFLQKASQKCVQNGEKPITIKIHERQSEITTLVLEKKYDATLADSTVISYTSRKTGGRLEKFGPAAHTLPQGILVSKNDSALTEAVQAAVQKLMDSGELKKILEHYGAGDTALKNANINPPAN
ncbi:MAG: transporter substrate-binding domain-containing protein [Actinomycetaceae bacterium]|nr:transporter substrate-binding domain-containing protein [Actinomycetaceae bacterium]